MTRQIVDEIKRSVTAVDVAYALGLHVDSRFRCRCLWHSDKHPSMKLYEGDRGCWCFACGHGGSVIDMVQQANNCSFPEAVRWLNDAFSLELDLDTKPDKDALKRAREAAEKREREVREREYETGAAFDLMADAERTMNDADDRIRRIAPNRDAWYDEDELYRLLKIREDMRIVYEDARNRYERLVADRYGKDTSNGRQTELFRARTDGRGSRGRAGVAQKGVPGRIRAAE